MSKAQASIARKLGLSRMTVSRALRGESGLAEETRQRIFAAARAAGVPVAPARNRTPDRKHLVCMVGASPYESLFATRLYAGMRQAAGDYDSELISCDDARIMDPDAPWPMLIAKNRVDGLVYQGGGSEDSDYRKPCPVPQVFLFAGPEHADVVGVDDFGGGIQLGTYLATMGHHRVAFIGPDTGIARARFAGIRMGMERAWARISPAGQRKPVEVLSNFTPYAGGQNAASVEHFLAGETDVTALRRRFTALACYNDWFAMHAILHLKTKGLRVPEDVSLTGFDDVAPDWYDGPKLTTCAMPLELLGQEIVRFLYWRIEHPGDKRRSLVLETQLVEGHTVIRA